MVGHDRGVESDRRGRRTARQGQGGPAQSRSGQLDKRPALEYLVGIDRHTGAYIPELAETWAMGADGKTWTITLRKGITFHEHWGEFTARDVRHAVFLITQPESVQTDAGLWRNLLGID